MPQSTPSPILKRRRIFRRLIRAIAAAAALALVLAIGLRNSVTSMLLTTVGSRFLQTSVTVDSVEIGWGTITLNQFSIAETGGGQHPLLNVKRIEVVSRVAAGISDGMYVGSVKIEQPKMTVRIDDAGEFLSRIPTVDLPESEPSESAFSLPVANIGVSGASLIVRQGSVDDPLVSEFDFELIQTVDRIDATARVQNLLRGQLRFATSLDRKTLAGQSRCVIRDCDFDSRRWPLTLAASPEPIGYHAGVEFKATHPGRTFLWTEHELACRGELQQFVTNSVSELPSFVRLDSTLDVAGLKVAVDANPIANKTEFRLVTTPLTFPFSGQISFRSLDLAMTDLIQRFAPGLPLELTAGLSAAGQFRWDGSEAALTTHSNLAATKIDFDGAAIADARCEVRCELRCNELMKVVEAPADFISRVTGLIAADVSCGPIETGNLKKCRRLDLTPLGDFGGTATISGGFQLPLDGDFSAAHLFAAAKSDVSIATADLHTDQIRVADSKLSVSLASAGLRVRLEGGEISDVDGRQIAALKMAADCDHILDGRFNVAASAAAADLSVLASLAGAAGDSCSGSLRTEISATAAVDRIVNPAAWTAAVDLRAADLRLIGETIGDVELAAKLDGGNFSVAPTELRWRKNVCRFAAAGRIDERASVRSQFSGGPIAVADIADVASRFSGTELPLSGWIDGAGSLSADLVAGSFECGGRSRLTDAVFGDATLGNATLDWRADLDGLNVQTESNDWFGGGYTATAQMRNLDWTQSKIDFRCDGVNLQRIAEIADSPLPVSGHLRGEFKLTSLGDIQQWVASGKVRTDGLRVSQAAAEISDASFKIAGGKANLAVTGKAFRGTLNGSAVVSLAELRALVEQPDPNFAELPVTASISIQGVDPVAIAAAVGKQQAARHAAGSLSLQVDRDDAVIHRKAIARVVASGEGLRWNRVRVSDRVAATAHLYPNRVILNSIDGRIADGKLFGRGEVQLAGKPSGSFQLGITRLNLRQLAVIGGQGSSGFSGTGNLRIDGRLDRNLTGHTALTADHAVLGGLKIRSVRMPIDWSFAPSTSTAAWRCRSGIIETGGGRIHVQCDGDYRNALTMKLASTVSNVDTSKLLVGSSAGAGKVDATVSLTAKRARSVQEFNGRFDMDLSQLDSMQLPVLDRLPTMMQLVPSANGLHQNVGHVRGRLSGGIVYIDNAEISQSNVQVTASGSATMDGRLDIDLTAATGSDSPTEGLLALTNSPLMLAAPAPAKLLIQANEALKNRVVNVHVGGNSRSPTIRLQPGKQLSQDALRFLISSQFGTSVAIAADRVRNDSSNR